MSNIEQDSKLWKVTFLTAGRELRSVHTMRGTRREVKAWAKRELPYFAPDYNRKRVSLRETPAAR